MRIQKLDLMICTGPFQLGVLYHSMNENDTSVTHGGGVEAQPRKMLSVKNLDLNDSSDCQRADEYC